MAHTLQERYSQLVLAKLRRENVIGNLFNRSYEGQPKAGAVKIPVRDTEVSVGSYDKANGGTLSTGSTSYQTLTIGNDIYVNELIDGYDAVAVPDNIVADRLDSAGYAIAEAIDTALATLLTTAQNYTAFAGSSPTSASTIYGDIVDIVTAAKKAKVKKSSMWLLVNSDTAALIDKAPEFIRATNLGDDTVTNGFLGKINGVPVYESIAIDDTAEYILGNSEFCHFVDEWSVPVGIKDLADGAHIGASAVQGRRVYGCKVSRPTTVFVKAKSVTA